MNEIYQTGQASKLQSAAYDAKTEKTNGKKAVKGAGTYGNPTLSDEALDYYNSLKKKYGNLNFVLVSADKKNEAEANKASFANSDKLTVLIDTDKIEKMASDKSYREKYESILSNATSGMTQMKSQLSASGVSTATFGMSFDDKGSATYFAVIDKSLEAQKERIEKNAEKKAEAKKAEAKKTAKEQAEKRIQDKADAEETVTITANSMDELLKKISDYYMNAKSDSVMTEDEKKVGQSFDFSV